MSTDGHDLVEQLREQIDAAPVDERNEQAVTVAIERYERAVYRLLDELHDTVSPNSQMVVLNRDEMTRVLARELGIELGR